MNMPPVIPLYRPWWARLAEDLVQRWSWRRSRAREDDVYAALAHLGDQTLRDIGAPPELLGRDPGLPLWELERSRY